jgi:hypothetical protein
MLQYNLRRNTKFTKNCLISTRESFKGSFKEKSLEISADKLK